MAAAVGRLCKSGLLQPRNGCYIQQVNKFSTTSWTKGQKSIITAIGALAGGAGALIFALDCSVKAHDNLHPAKLPWNHNGWFQSLDHASIRRGYEVYKQVCSACHSMEFMTYRRLINVSHTEEEAKREAEEVNVQDGPDDNGEFFTRPGRISDHFPSPYPNIEAARAANNGAYPPDLSLITLARPGGEDYIFHLLTGYVDPPAGIPMREGMYYNPYFPGGSISMAKALYDEVIEYSDGTPATASQLAKDVCTFLKWSAEPEFDVRAKLALKTVLLFPIAFFIAWYYKRFVWMSLKSRKIVYNPPPPRHK
ncbi:UNVERIFIED_CONTAM: hypothetical protein PYX00_008214 [Menopon gallinae]|uniref:Cytochrome c domain-containing protein n=1 Tax=Menopon gallinae TaxID=328185 RepID=A0AAW2HLV9_9NEOP